MAEDLNAYFSSVFTREDISSLPVPDAKFYLIVTPEMVAWKIKAIKDDKSPGEEQISIPLASMLLLNGKK